MELIVHQGNDYLVSVKGNQAKLLQAMQTVSQQQQPRSHQHTTERRGNRLVERSVSVFEDVSGINQQWVNPQSVIAVPRAGTRDGKSFDKMSYYLSSLDADALELGLGIRRHRDIENRLHWLKDVVFGEAAALFPNANAATFWSIVRTIALNLLRRAGYASVTRGLRALRHDIDALFHLVTKN